MCGIAGFFSAGGSNRACRNIGGILRAQAHRGPNGAGVWANGEAAYAPAPDLLVLPEGNGATCVLGHNWLAIQDTNAGARQPMVRGPLTLVFNGEIYNFVELRQELAAQGETFSTRGDTEVLLALWRRLGIDCLPKLRGMFAFLLHDARDGSLWAVRDAFGIKPMYFVETVEGVYFASEIRGFHQAGIVPRRIRPGAAMASVAGAAHRFATFETLYEGVSELPAGHWMRMDAIGRRTEQWYQFPEFTRELNRDEDCDGLLAAIEESVRIHLRSSRRVASCLSGGLDSSTLVQLIGRHLEEAGKNFSAFTINSADQRDSEVDLAREVTANARLPHQVFDVQTAIPAIDALDMAIAYEIPNHVIGPINQFLLLRHIAETGATVVLDGQGGDELVSGYTWWFPVLVADMRRRGKHAEADAIEAQRPFHLPFDAPTTRSFDQIFYDPEAWLRGFMGQELLGLKLAEVAEQPEFRYYFEHDGSWEGFRQRAYQTDTLHFLLRQEDRLGMRFGLECRVPFVDTEVVRAVAGLAPELLIRDGYLKYPLRRMRSGIPESVRWTARKRGFWETTEARFPWMSGLAFQFAMQSTLVPQMFPRLEEDWHTTRSDQQWRILQIALLERCPTRADAEDALREMEPLAVG